MELDRRKEPPGWNKGVWTYTCTFMYVCTYSYISCIYKMYTVAITIFALGSQARTSPFAHEM